MVLEIQWFLYVCTTGLDHTGKESYSGHSSPTAQEGGRTHNRARPHREGELFRSFLSYSTGGAGRTWKRDI